MDRAGQTVRREGYRAKRNRPPRSYRIVCSLLRTAPPGATLCPGPAKMHVAGFRKSPCRPRRKSFFPRAHCALDRVAPPAPFAFTRGLVHARLKAALAFPQRRKSLELRTQSRSIARHVSCTERGRLLDNRAIDGCCQDIRQELHGKIARGHSTVYPQDRICGGRQIGAHSLDQVTGLIANLLERRARQLGCTSVAGYAEHCAACLRIPPWRAKPDKRGDEVDVFGRIGGGSKGVHLGCAVNQLKGVA